MSWINDRYQDLKDALNDKVEVREIPLGKYNAEPETSYQVASREDALKAYQEEKWPDYALKTLDNIFGEEKVNGYYKSTSEEGVYQVCGVHGSVMFEGEINNEGIKLQCHILRTRAYKPSMLRILLESSVIYDYIRYGINEDDDIVALVQLEKREAAPMSIYQAISEMCTNANLYDSLIATEYEDISWLNQNHVKYESDEVVNIKYDYYTTGLKEVKDYIAHSLDDNQSEPINIAYRLLGFMYKMDYLISPRNYLYGYFMDKISDYWGYLNTQNSDFHVGLGILKEAIEDIPEMSKLQFKEEVVSLPNLFSVKEDWNSQSMVASMQSNLPNLQNYYTQNDFINLYWGAHVVLGGLAFHFNLDKYWQTWVSSLMACLDGLYISKLGILPPFLKEDQTQADLQVIKKWLETAIKDSQESSQPLPPLPEELDLQDPITFVYQILMVFSN